MTSNWLKDLRPRSNTVKTFKSYVDLDCPEEQSIPNEPDKIAAYNYEDKDVSHGGEGVSFVAMLGGEVLISQAENVLKFNTLSELNKGVSGALLATNFRLSFRTAENFPSNLHQRNILLGEHDISLVNIDAVYQVVSGKRKKLSLSSTVSHIEIIEIHCKDFRIYTFSFKFSPTYQRSVITTIIHHAFPPKINLLFAFEYKELSSEVTDVGDRHSLFFTEPCDWEAELERCRCPGWRVTQANEKFLLCESLPESFVVPSILLDMNLNKTAPHFAGHRVPTWSWGLPSGASIIRMAAIDPSISDSQQKHVMIDAISRASPRQLSVQSFSLGELNLGYKEVQTSFLKLKDLCMPSSENEFWEQEMHYLAKLDATKWLQHISSCLKVALEAANCLLHNMTVILSEHEGRDLSAVVSSLVQIMLDPLYRTKTGFELLLQKEWVALGHPFTERFRLVTGSESEQSPVFLLFLDCVWQLSEQCPAVFEFSETYLTSIWDSVHVGLFDTFLFSCHKTRLEAVHTRDSSFRLRSVWQWDRQFSKNHQRLFSNPLYILNRYKRRGLKRPKSLSGLSDRPIGDGVEPWGEDEENLLRIDPHIKSLKLWHQCYLRWIPLAHILGGGPPVLALTNLKMAAEIEALEKSIRSLQTRSTAKTHRRVQSDDFAISSDVLDAGIQDGASIITSVFPFAPVAPWDWTHYHCVPSTACLQISYTESEDDLEE